MSLELDLNALDPALLSANNLMAESIRASSADGVLEVVVGRGAFVGDVRALTNGGLVVDRATAAASSSSSTHSKASEKLGGGLQAFSAIMTKPGQVLMIERSGLNAMFYSYPGMFIALYDIIFRV